MVAAVAVPGLEWVGLPLVGESEPGEEVVESETARVSRSEIGAKGSDPVHADDALELKVVRTTSRELLGGEKEELEMLTARMREAEADIEGATVMEGDATTNDTQRDCDCDCDGDGSKSVAELVRLSCCELANSLLCRNGGMFDKSAGSLQLKCLPTLRCWRTISQQNRFRNSCVLDGTTLVGGSALGC